MKRIFEENLFNTRESIDKEVDESPSIREWNTTDNYRMNKLLGHCRGGTCLELGPLNMATAKTIKERFPDADVYALDISQRIVDIFGEKAPDVKYMLHDLREKLPFPDDNFDYITAGEIFEHMDDPQVLMNECKRVLKKGGYLAISVPHNESTRGDRGGKWHMWSFESGDIGTLWGGECEEEVAVERSAKRRLENIIAWCRK